LTKGTRVTVEGVWSKRTRTTKDGQPRINDVLTVTKIRLFTETEISRPNVVEDGDEPALSRETHHRWHQRRLLGSLSVHHRSYDDATLSRPPASRDPSPSYRALSVAWNNRSIWRRNRVIVPLRRPVGVSS
jgi:single-stranded DNA-binding protein